jgi:hypothetical protein
MILVHAILDEMNEFSASIRVRVPVLWVFARTVPHEYLRYLRRQTQA